MLRMKLTTFHTSRSLNASFMGFISDMGVGAPFQIIAKISPSLDP
jgi:hypothetical protein